MPTRTPAPVPAHPDVAIESQQRVWDGRFPLEVTRFRHRRFDGAMSGTKTWETWRRGRAAAVVPYDPDTDTVVLIEQFRFPALVAGLDPVLVELPAGLVDDGETPEQTARREMLEEMALTVGELRRIGSYLLTPGGADEVCELYVGRVDGAAGGRRRHRRPRRHGRRARGYPGAGMAGAQGDRGRAGWPLHQLGDRPGFALACSAARRDPRRMEDAMTERLFQDDPRLRSVSATVIASAPEGIVLDRTVFYARGGGQPGDAGVLRWDGGETPVADTVKGEGDAILHVPAPGAALPPVGATVEGEIDWDRRHQLMRMHTAMHLLCSVIKGAAVTGGSVGADRSRLDFDLPNPPPKESGRGGTECADRGGSSGADRVGGRGGAGCEPRPGAHDVGAAAARHGPAAADADRMPTMRWWICSRAAARTSRGRGRSGR